MKINRIIGKNSLILVAQGKSQLAAQIFNYDQIREIRMDLEDLEVKILLSCDESYHRVYKIKINDKITLDEAKKSVFAFYNNLLNASMKLSKEEIENLKKQKEKTILEINKEIEKNKSKNNNKTKK